MLRLKFAEQFSFHTRMNRRLLRRAFSSSNIELSYLHKIGAHQLRYANIGQVLSETASKFPDRFALISCMEGTRITFAETLDKVDRLACSLMNLGLEQGDRVAIWAPNYEFWFVSKLAIARAGLICVTMNPAYQAPEMEFCLSKIEAKAIIAPEKFFTQNYYEMLTKSIEKNGKTSLQHVIMFSDKKLSGTIDYNELIRSSSESELKKLKELKVSPDSCCNIQFTSGTTGQPKACSLSHYNLVNAGKETGSRLDLDKVHATILNNTPFFHVAGLTALMHGISCGSTVVLPAPHFNGEMSVKALAKEKCNYIYGTPNMYLDMISRQKELKLKLPEVLNAVIGAAPTPKEVIFAAKKYLNIKQVRCNFGMTETSCVGFGSVTDEDEKFTYDTVGHLADHAELKIIDDEGNVVPLGQPGELCLRGYFTMMGYWGEEEKTKQTLTEDKWLKTGDQFILTKEGYGKIVGRLKEMIIRGGENIFPKEIEDFLHTHPNVQEAHVIGIPDPQERMGEEIGAFIKLKDKLKPLRREELREFGKGKISHFKVPRYVLNVDRDFPKTSTGKVHKIKFPEYFKDEIEAVVSQDT